MKFLQGIVPEIPVYTGNLRDVCFVSCIFGKTWYNVV